MLSSQNMETKKNQKNLSGRLCLKVGLCHLLSLHLSFRERKGESICPDRRKQVLEERRGLSV